jgi:hypothetical protein
MPQLEAYDLGYQHRHRLPKHRRFGLDTAYAPSQYGEAVDHRRMAIGSYHRIGIGPFGSRFATVCGPHGLRQQFEIDLMADSCAGRHYGQIAERVLPPFQQLIALGVALIFERDIP